MGKMTNVNWVVYGQDVDQPKLVILTNLFPSEQNYGIKLFPSRCIQQNHQNA